MMHPVQRGPFIETARREVYKSNWIKFEEALVVRPDGMNGSFGLVTMRNGTTIVAVDDDNHVYFVREYKYAYEAETLELISGGMDDTENPEETALRELREETGFTASKLTYLGKIDPFTTVIKSTNHMVLAQGLVQTGGQTTDDYIEGVVRIPLTEAVEMVMRGEIGHGASNVAILKAARLLGV